MRIQDPWFKKICDSYVKPPVEFRGEQLPGFPSDTLQINTTGQSGIPTLTDAFVFYEDCVNTFEELGTSLQDSDKLLDFGVGWGRITRFFLKELPLKNIYGVDIMEEFIQICRDTFLSNNFMTCQPYPPLSFSDNELNFIVGYSVFSHLSEEACTKWMQEFHRILAPGGVVALTTRGRPFFDYCENLRAHDNEGYQAALATCFDDFDAARRQYDRGELVHSNNEALGGGGAMSNDFYGETFIPELYAKTAYSEIFIFKKFLFDNSRQAHPIMFFQKR